MAKRLYTMIFLAAVGAASAFAQWNTNATPVCIFGLQYTDPETGEMKTGGDYYACNPKAVRTPDKKTWIAWKTGHYKEINGIKRHGECTYLQLLDINGVPQFEEPILVNDHVTPSWWSEYSLCVAADGSAIVTVADSRGEEADMPDYITYTKTDENGEEYEVQEPYTSGKSFYPAIYKVDQEGNFLWGLDGISFDWAYYSPYTYAAVAGSNTYFIFKQMASFEDIVAETDGAYLVRIDEEGIWQEPLKLSDNSLLHAQIIASEGEDFLLFSDTPDGACVTRYTPEMEDVWGGTVTYDENKYEGYAMNQYKLASDGNGGACVAFVRAMGGFTHNIRVQHINGDGSLGFGLEGLDAANTEDNDYDYCGIAVNPENEEIMVDFESQLPYTYDVMLQKFSFDGDYLFDELGLSIANKNRATNAYAFGQVGCGAIPGTSDWIVCYRDVQAYVNASFVICRYDKDGTRVWKKTIGRELDPTGITFVVEKEASYLFYRETRSAKEPGIKIFRISHNGDYNVTYDMPEDPTGIQTVATGNGQEQYFSADGKQLQQLQRGLNIVRSSDGKIRKMVKD